MTPNTCLKLSKFASLHGLKSTNSKLKTSFESYSKSHVQIDEHYSMATQQLDDGFTVARSLRLIIKGEEKLWRIELQKSMLRARQQVDGQYTPLYFDRQRRVSDLGSTNSHDGQRKRGRGTLKKESVDVLKQWLFSHFSHPYPSEDEKIALAGETGLKPIQVNYWFINARVRIWRPLLDSIEKKSDGGKRCKGRKRRPSKNEDGGNEDVEDGNDSGEYVDGDE